MQDSIGSSPKARDVLDELADKAGWEYHEMLVVACAFIDDLRSPWAFKEFAEKQCQPDAPEEDEITLVDLSPPKEEP